MILFKWYNSQNGRLAYDISQNLINNIHIYFVHARNLHIPYIYDPAITWYEYYGILQFAQTRKEIHVYMYCEDIMSNYKPWIRWLEVSFYIFSPRTSEIKNLFAKSMINLLIIELQEGAFESLELSLFLQSLCHSVLGRVRKACACEL